MYKKLFSIALSLVLILGIGSFATLADETQPTQSADFTVGFDTEAELEGWNPSGRGERPVIDTNVTDSPASENFGSGSLKFEALENAVSGLGLYRRVENLKPGATYIFSAWTKNDTAGISAIGIGVGKHTTDSASTYYSYSDYSVIGKWGRVACAYTVPTDGTGTAINLLLKQAVSTSTSWFESISFSENTGNTSAVIHRSDILMNGGFEDATMTDLTNSSTGETTEELLPYGWTINGIKNSSDSPEYAIVSDDTAHGGMYSLKMCGKTYGKTKKVYKQLSNIEPGASYLVTAYVKMVGGTSSSGLVMRITKWPTEGAGYSWDIGTASLKAKTADSPETGGWVPIRTTFTYPAEPGNNKAHISFNMESGASESAVAYIDDITVEKIGKPGVTFLDASGLEITSIPNKTTDTDVTVDFYGANGSDAAALNYTLVCALYDESGAIKQMSSVTLNDKTVPAAAEYSHSSYGTFMRPGYLKDQWEVTVPAGHSLKVLAFDNLGSISTVAAASLS